MRALSVIAMTLAVIPLFYLGKKLQDGFVGFWASCFYVLAPACVALAKQAKPHAGAAALTLTAIYFCFKAREDTRPYPLLVAALCLGFSIGAAMSQIAFLPFLLWACWAASPKATFKRAFVAGPALCAIYLATNFYLLTHFQDYKDETYFTSHYYPFAFRLTALWDFLKGALQPSMGWVLWLLSVGSVAYAIYQKEHPKIRVLALLSFVVFSYISFQTQSQLGSPLTSRLGLALIGIWCLCAVWAISRLPGRNWIAGAVLGNLLVMAVFYNRHFASDRVPIDNASLAALWIRDHVPAGSIIGQDHIIPHPIDFPPIDFTNYRIRSFSDPEFQTGKEPVFAVIPVWWEPSRQFLLDHHFSLIRVFAESPIQKLGFSDPFTPANFPLEIYETK